MSDVRMIIGAKLETGASTIAEINKNIKYLQTQVDSLNLKIQIDNNVLKTLNNFSTQMSRLSNEAMKASKNVQEVFMPDGTRVKTSSFENLNKNMDELVISGKKAKTTVDGILKSTQQTADANKQVNTEVQKGNKENKERERVLQAEHRIKRAIAEKEEKDREKALRYEQSTRVSIDKTNQKEKLKTLELQKQLQLYKQQATMNSQNISRTHGTTIDNKALGDYNRQVRQLSIDTPNLNHRMKELNMQFKQVSGNAKQAAGALQQSGMSMGEMMRTAMVKFPIKIQVGLKLL